MVVCGLLVTTQGCATEMGQRTHVNAVFGDEPADSGSTPDNDGLDGEEEQSGTDTETPSVPDAEDTGLGAPEEEIIPCDVQMGDHLPVPVQSTERFLDSCASCHGKQGEGHEEFVGSIIDIEYDRFEAMTRSGLHYHMPDFDEDEYPAALLAYDWAWLNGEGAELTSGCEDGPMTAPEETPLAELDRRIEQAQIAWQTPDEQGLACANCHGPEPIDLAYVGYSTGDLLRRALLHLDTEQAWDITYGVQAMRLRDGMVQRDPETFVPFQPGGAVIDPAELPEGASDNERRDHAFGLQLAELAPTLFGAPIADTDQAWQALEELRGIDVRSLPVGFSLNRWTVDAIRGLEFRSFGEWIPEVGHISADHDELMAVHDAYLDNPTDTAFRDLVISTLNSTEQREVRPEFDAEGPSMARDIYRAKYISTLTAQHLMRQEVRADIELSERGPQLLGEWALYAEEVDGTRAGLIGNPWWQLSLEAGLAAADPGCLSDTGCGGFSSDVAVDDVPVGAAMSDEVAALELPWGWMGFMFDHALDTSGPDGVHETADGYVDLLLDEGFHNHLIFFVLRRNLALTLDAVGWSRVYGHELGGALASHRQDWFGLKDPDSVLSGPVHAEAREQYLLLLANGLRAWNLALTDEVAASGRVFGRYEADATVSLSSDFDGGEAIFRLLHDADWSPTLTPPSHWTATAKQDARMVAQLRIALGEADDLTSAHHDG